MARKTPKSRQIESRLPVERYWEERLRSWENDIGKDWLGSDHEARFATVNLLTAGDTEERKLQKGYISRETIRDLVRPLNLDDAEPLIDRLWTLAGRHLRPVHRLLLGSDPNSTQKQLIAVQSKALALDQELDELAPVTVAFLEEFHRSLPEKERHLSVLNLNMFSRTLGDLAILCAKASNELLNVAHAPPLVLRRQTIRDAVEAIQEHSGCRVLTRWDRKGTKCYEFKGVEGSVFRSFMKLIEPKTSEMTLVKLVREFAAERRRSPSTP